MDAVTRSTRGGKMIVVADFIDLLFLIMALILLAPAVFEILINRIRNRKGKQ